MYYTPPEARIIKHTWLITQILMILKDVAMPVINRQRLVRHCQRVEKLECCSEKSWTNPITVTDNLKNVHVIVMVIHGWSSFTFWEVLWVFYTGFMLLLVLMLSSAAWLSPWSVFMYGYLTLQHGYLLEVYLYMGI